MKVPCDKVLGDVSCKTRTCQAPDRTLYKEVALQHFHLRFPLQLNCIILNQLQLLPHTANTNTTSTTTTDRMESPTLSPGAPSATAAASLSEPASPASRSRSSSRSSLRLDLSNLPPLVQPAKPSNTLLITVGLLLFFFLFPSPFPLSY